MNTFSAPEPPEQFLIDQGWTRQGGVWFKPNGEPVFFIDIINAYPPLKAWVEEKTACCRDGSCAPELRAAPEDEHSRC